MHTSSISFGSSSNISEARLQLNISKALLRIFCMAFAREDCSSKISWENSSNIYNNNNNNNIIEQTSYEEHIK